MIGVLADDLTGALGSAARLRRGGLEPVVVWRPEDLPDAFNPRAVVVDMRTRDSPAGPRATAREWAQRLRERGCARYEQRIDSTLRGEPAEELAGLLEGAQLGGAVVVAVPAWPDAGRVCVGGRQRARGTTREIEVAPALFGEEPAEVVGTQALVERVRAGAVRRFVVDGESDEDLRACAEAVGALEEPVVTASPGGWLQYHPMAARAGAEFVLVVLSSNTELNHRQLDTLREGRPVAHTSDHGGTVLIETIAQSHPDDIHRDPRHADAAASDAARLLADAQERGLRCRGVVASGGHLASLLVDALGAQRLSVSGEVAPLCARGTIAGGPWSGLTLVTKGGLVGDDDTLAALVEDLWKEQ
jgi:D-threonate/D-erythronate kinase